MRIAAVVAEAADGQSALQATRDHRPAIVLLDVELPDMSGLSVAARLPDNLPARERRYQGERPPNLAWSTDH